MTPTEMCAGYKKRWEKKRETVLLSKSMSTVSNSYSVKSWNMEPKSTWWQYLHLNYIQALKTTFYKLKIDWFIVWLKDWLKWLNI